MSWSAIEQRNHERVMSLFAEVLNPLNADRVDAFISADYIQHSALAPPGREALKDFLRNARRESPDAVHEIKRSFADGDHVIVHYHVRRWPGDEGFAVVDIFRVEDGMIVEHWDVLQPIDPNRPNPNSMF